MSRSKAPADEVTLSDRLRAVFKGVLDPAGRWLIRLGLSPNALTLIGFGGNVVAAYLLARGWFLAGGLVFLALSAFDALDGTVARLSQKVTRFGAFLDSTLDRYAELAVFAGLLYFYLGTGDALTTMVLFAAAAGSVLVSYTRARAEALGFTAKGGLLTRALRVIILGLALVLGFPAVGLWVIAILANFTAIQRIWIVYRQGDLDG